MLTVDASVWVAAFDPTDAFHGESVATLAAATRAALPLCAPAFMVLETVCALRRRLGAPEPAGTAGEMLRAHPRLTLEPLTEDLLRDAERLGTERGLRGADALYVAVAERLAAPIVSWDAELVGRAGAITPRDWLRGSDAGRS